MARAKKRAPQVEEVRPYVEGVAKNLIDKLYGPQGPPWGTRLTEIEDLFLAIREVLGEKMLADIIAGVCEAMSQAELRLKIPGSRRMRVPSRVPSGRAQAAHTAHSLAVDQLGSD